MHASSLTLTWTGRLAGLTLLLPTLAWSAPAEVLELSPPPAPAGIPAAPALPAAPVYQPPVPSYAPAAVPQPPAPPDAPEAVYQPPAPPVAPLASAVPYISGGVGASSREKLALVKNDYNLHLLFAATGTGEYLADVEVRIEDASGAGLLSAVSEGPLFYVRLAPGRYRLVVSSAGMEQRRDILIPPQGRLSQAFYWQAPDWR